MENNVESNDEKTPTTSQSSNSDEKHKPKAVKEDGEAKDTITPAPAPESKPEEDAEPGKPPSTPKRPLSAFYWFVKDHRTKVELENPEWTMGEIARELGSRWVNADNETKAKYEGIFDRDKEIYDREFAIYHKNRVIPEPESPRSYHRRIVGRFYDRDDEQHN